MPYTAAQLQTIYTNANDGLATDSATQLLLQAYSVQNQNGSLTDAQTLNTVLHLNGGGSTPVNSPESTTDVALTVYQFFSGVGNGGVGTTVSKGGLDYLVNPALGGNANALGSSYYAQFNTANRYINLSVGLATGAGQYSAAFAAAYSNLTFAQTVQTAYEQIVGSSVVGASQAAAAEAGITAQQSYFQQFVAQYAPTANQDLAAKAAVIGYILEEAIKGDVGVYAQAVDNLQTTLATTGTATYGGNLLANYGGTGAVGGTQTYVLTTGVDTVQGSGNNNNFIASLTPFNVDGKGPTLQAGDSVNGGSGANNTLTLIDSSGSGNDIVPVGATIANIQNVVLQTAGNAGASSNGTSGTQGGVFSTTNLPSVTSVTVTSQGNGADNVAALNTTNITVNHQNTQAGAVTITGGQNVVVTNSAGGVAGGAAAGAITIGNTVSSSGNSYSNNPTGTVTATGLGAITINGGTGVNVTENGNNAAVLIGSTTIGAGFNASGAVGVVDTGTGGSVTIDGGTTATVTASGDTVTVGALVSPNVFTASGAINITNTAAVPLTHNFAVSANPATASTGVSFATNVLGGTNVSVNTNTGPITVGTATLVNNAPISKGNPTGNVTLVTSATTSGATITEFGGVNVQASSAQGAITIGAALAAATANLPVLDPTGAIAAAIQSAQAYDAVLDTTASAVTVFGGTNVAAFNNVGNISSTNATGNVTVTDAALRGGATAVNIQNGANVIVTDNSSAVTVGGGTALTNATGQVLVQTNGLETGKQFATSITINGAVGGATALTSGGSVTVGTSTTPVTGAVNVTDTLSSNANTDAFTVIGGSTVNISATATSGAITVGGPTVAALNPAGTALSTPGLYATGVVTIVNAALANSTLTGGGTLFGTGNATVSVLGSPSVAISGAGNVTITDEATTIGSNGKAIGASTLSAVALNTITGNATITSDALTAFAIIGTGKGVTNAITLSGSVATNEPAHTLALQVIGENATGIVNLTDNSATTIAVTGSAGGTLGLVDAAATAVTFANTGALTLGTIASGTTSLTKVATITATGSGALTLGDLSTVATLKTIDVSASSGATTVSLSPATASFKGGAGQDVVTVNQNAVGAGVSVVAGSNTGNIVILNYAANTLTDTAPVTNFRGFAYEGLGALATGAYDATGFSNLLVGAPTNGAVIFANVATGTNLAIGALTPGTILAGVTLAYKGATAGAATISLVSGAVGANDTVTLSQQGLGTGTLTPSQATGAITSLNIVDAGTKADTLTLVDTGLAAAPAAAGTSAVTSITLTGTASDTVNLTTANTASVTTINASGSTGVDNVTGVALSLNGATITGGGNLTAKGEGVFTIAATQGTGTAGADSFTTGAGGGNYVIGTGGSWNQTVQNGPQPPVAPNTGVGNYDTGSETVVLTASATVVDKLGVRDGAISTANGSGKGGVTGFAVTLANADQVNYLKADGVTAQPKTELVNQGTATKISTVANFAANVNVLDQSGALATALSNLAYTSSNGVITFSAAGTANIANFNSTQLIDAAELVLAAAGVDKVAAFTTGGNTFVVSSSDDGIFTSKENGSSVVQLTGVSTVTGLGTVGAAGSIVTSAALNASTAANTGAGAAFVYNDAGFSLDTSANGGTSTVINNLGAAGIITATQGAITVNQVTPGAGDSLTVNLNGTVTSLTSSDGYLYLSTAAGGGTIGTLTDAGGALSVLSISGGNALTITNPITATTLTTINASLLSGNLTLTDNVSALSFTGGSAGAETLALNGAADKITFGAHTGNVTLTASGSGDALTDNSTGTTDLLTIGGAGDTLTVTGTGNVSLAGTFAAGVLNSALGTGDIINLQNTAGTSSVFVGLNSTVNLGTTAAPFALAATATVEVAGSTAGTALAGLTTISGLAGAQGTLNVLFNSATTAAGTLGSEAEHLAGGSIANAFVNVSGATSLAAALNTAASQAIVLDAQLGGGSTTVSAGVLTQNAGTGSIDWFQYGGNTYIVEANNPTALAAAHTGLGSTDVVVKLVGLVDLSAATFAAHQLSGI